MIYDTKKDGMFGVCNAMGDFLIVVVLGWVSCSYVIEMSM